MLTAALASTTMGCVGAAAVYDPYRRAYRRWSFSEDRVYRRWEFRTNRNHMDFQRRSSEDRQAYWSWRHGGSSKGHGRH